MAVNFSSWNWSFVCPTGLQPWDPTDNYLAPCFQKICLQLPVLAAFAITSAYYCGFQAVLVRRNSTQKWLISLRIFVSLFFILLPMHQLFEMIIFRMPIWPIDILITGFQAFAWGIHIGFLLKIRHHGELSHRGPMVVIVLWLALTVLACIWMHSSIATNSYYSDVAVVALYAVYALTLTMKGSSAYIHRRNIEADERQSLIGTYVRFQDDIQIEALGPATDDATWLSKLIFHWVDPLIEKGLNGNLKRIDDLFDLPESLSINSTVESLLNALSRSLSLFRALHRTFGIEFYSIGLLRFASDTLGFAGPLLLAGLLSSESNDKNGTDTKAYLYALGLFAIAFFGAFFNTHFNWRISLVSLKMRMGITTAIYKKTLSAQFVDSNSPEVLNLMSTDTDRIVNSCVSFHSFWSIPFQLFVVLYLLYTKIGVSFIGGVIFAVILIPINRWLANKIQSLTVSLLEAKDARVSQSFEALSGAKQIKMLAWEDVFLEKIENLRKTELVSLRKRKYLDALCVYFWATTPMIINLLTFGTAALLGHPITAASGFASVALLNQLIAPLNAFPWILNGLVEAYISLKRVQSYLDLPDIDLHKFYSPMRPETPTEEEPNPKPIVISLRNVSFCYSNVNREANENEDNHVFIISPVTGDIKKRDLICLEGPVGAGKTAFLNAISGNLSRINGNIHLRDIDDGMAFVAQQPWLQHGTMRENIVFGELFDESRYRKVLFACALHRDIDDLGGDNIDIGEGGSSLSGGQKARVALARAVYQDKQIYCIDDVLAALDAHVAKHIVKHCILGLLKDKTRIVVTENRTLFYYSNQILHIENGAVTTSDFALGSFESEYADTESSDDELNTPISFELSNQDSSKAESSIFEEIKEAGALSTRVLVCYWRAWGSTVCLLVLLSVVLMQASKNFSDTWLANWIKHMNTSNYTVHMKQPSTLLGTKIYAESMKENVLCYLLDQFIFWRRPNHSNGVDGNYDLEYHSLQISLNSYYLAIYITVAVFNSICALLRAFLFAYGGLKAAKFIHKKLLYSVFYTEFSFFDVTPLGRILNRFSSDTYTIDDSLPFILNILVAQVFGLIGVLCVSLYAMPWLALLVVPMTPVYLNIQSRYRNSSRDIKRLSSNSMSPIYTHFTETVCGLATIRAMRSDSRFHRDFLVKLEDSIRAQLTSSAAQQWLGLRLQLLGAFLVGGSGFIAVITSAHSTGPEMVGLVIAYLLQITGLLNGVLTALTETEQELIAVERVNGYCNLNREVNADGSQNAPFSWPIQGVVKFDDVYMKYRPYLHPSLNGISFQTSPCERIGIVGRTGAGKSSIMAALMRVAPLHSGVISIDATDISRIPLNVLRSRLALVPQDAFLFSGTVRENLDPRNTHLDSDIWNAINRCLATPLVQSLGGLSACLDFRGSNISAGQKQLLCLARALLRKSKIVIIDEGTSNLDSDSENAIQLILRNAFESCTVLLIAHRLNGLQSTDRIFVIDNGRIVEEGRPQDLATDADTRFHSLLQEQQSLHNRSRSD